jgi:hypothetical protein
MFSSSANLRWILARPDSIQLQNPFTSSIYAESAGDRNSEAHGYSTRERLTSLIRLHPLNDMHYESRGPGPGRTLRQAPPWHDPTFYRRAMTSNQPN